MNERFKAKLLLFGEYVILNGGNGFALPIQNYYGELNAGVDTAVPVNKEALLDFEKFFQHIYHSPTLKDCFKIDLLEKSISSMSFSSNIPIGHGIGSSGALCASVCFHYLNNQLSRSTVDNAEILFLKDILSLLESYYHGSSSGIDPLISYLDRPIYLEKNCTQFNSITLSIASRELLSKVFLVDTKLSRKASLYVHKYLQKIEQGGIDKGTLERMVSLNNNLIVDLIEGNELQFKKNLYELSKLQFLHFKEMIPEQIISLWYQGLENGDFLLKLCGAGGGGFSLGWKFNTSSSESLNKYAIIEDLQI
ncbi:hypothetical protein N9N67_04375 [Bacteriovoracaceae bacterium]|nr:hypothetical protein [Bacteriovoracaceae bacterium]